MKLIRADRLKSLAISDGSLASIEILEFYPNLPPESQIIPAASQSLSYPVIGIKILIQPSSLSVALV